MNKQVTVNNKTYVIEEFFGRVVESNRERETKVSGSGGGGATWNGYGTTAPVDISSETTVHDEFFLIDEQGNEKYLHLTNWDIPLRVGHQIQAVWIYPGNSKTGYHVAIFNKNLDKLEINKITTHRLALIPYVRNVWFGWIVVFLLAIIIKSGWFFMFGWFTVFVFYILKAGKIQKILHAEVMNILR